MPLRMPENAGKVLGRGYTGRLMLVALGCFVVFLACFVMPDHALYAQSLDTFLQNVTPEQRQALQSLTPEERRAMQMELVKNGGKPTPEMLEKLKAVGEAEQTSEKEAQKTAKPKMASPQETLEHRAAAEMQEKTFSEKTGRDGLARFGFDYFAPSRKRILAVEDALGKGEVPAGTQLDALSGFVGPLDMVAASVNASIPPQYVLSPGDQVTIYYWGDLLELTTLKLKLDKTGAVSIPQSGRLVARGMSLPQLENGVRAQLQRVLGKNVRLIATLDNLESVQVFITGEAFRPGAYSVSAVTTLFNALYACGGPSDQGSLRDIKLVRDKKTIALDFYDFLLNGKGKSDYSLQPGDTIVIGRTGKLVSIAGEVGRPGVYELTNDETLRDLVGMAHGIKPSGLTNKVLILSVLPHRERAIIAVDLSGNAPSSDHRLLDGDAVTVSPVVEDIQNIVTLTGAVKVPGVVELKKDMKVADLFNEVNQPWGDALLDRADVIRLGKDRKTTTAIPVNLGKALQKDPENNIPLAPLDYIVVYSKWDVKYYPARIVTIQGAVQKPGDYPRTEGMRIMDLLRLAGGTLPGSINEITVSKARFFAEPNLLTVKADLLEQGDESQNILLDDEDVVMVRSDSAFLERPLWVTVNGEVRFPGTYPLMRKNYRLSELIRQAGGLTRAANPKGAVFLRKSKFLPSPEQTGSVQTVNAVVNELNRIEFRREAARNMLLLKQEAREPAPEPPAIGAGIPVISTGTDIKEAAQIGMAPSIAQSAGQLSGNLLDAFVPGSGVTSEARTLTDEQLKQSQRVIIDLDKALKGDRGNQEDITLMSGDLITIPQRTDTASVTGAVLNPVTVNLVKKRKVKDIVALAGGYAMDADDESVLVMRVNGAIYPAGDVHYVEAGDIIYVPTRVVTTEILTTTDKIINAVKFTLATAASVIVFLAIIP